MLGKRVLKRSAKENVDYKNNGNKDGQGKDKKRDAKAKKKKDATLGSSQLTSGESDDDDSNLTR